MNKIKSLPVATKEQLEQHNDICAICYQVGMEVSEDWLELKYPQTQFSLQVKKISDLNYVE